MVTPKQSRAVVLWGMVLLGQPPVSVSTYIEDNDKSLSEVEEPKSDAHNASFNH